MNSVLMAHVADSIERISGGEAGDYDATADFAAKLLDGYPQVLDAAERYNADTMVTAEFDEIVRRAAGLAGE